jgi:hypothetical protein
MLNPHLRAQRRVDVACGYALGAYLGVTLTWAAALIGSGFAFFALMVAGVAGLFGTLRTIVGMSPRFWMIPVASLVFVKLSLVCSYYNAIFVIIFSGFVFTAGFAILIARLFKYDFAKSIPAWICKGCGYPLTGLPGPKCPECGERFDPDKVPDVSIQPQVANDRLQ